MATHQITIAKASKNDFEKVYNLLSPMEELFNNRWSNEESWTEWDDDNEDKLELLAIRKEIAEEEYCDEDEVDKDAPLLPTNMRIWKAPKMKRKDLLLFLRRKHTFYVQ